MIAVFVNCAVVILGSILGVLFSRKISDPLSEVISTAAGVISIVIGIKMALGFSNIVFLTLSMILGGLTGTAADIDGRIHGFGGLLEKVFFRRRGQELPVTGSGGDAPGRGRKDFPRAFLNGSVLFCVGAMSIIGSLQAGIQRDYTIILTKSVLDGFMAVVFSAALGIGTAFSAITILVYQGLLTLFASAISRFMTDEMLGEISAAGGVLVLMIGLGLAGVRQIKTANYLPALVFIALFVLLGPYLPKIS
ncbi:MAG: DUF554 domain-containing protein [Spirochaetaceae bacterium]|jgi:uncharacterized membrane protein YqgA involved in biofilm formation|nr:DUF554 domain-containing protein [Spirochaetaceae bacterium]